jgi:hypothetical protein
MNFSAESSYLHGFPPAAPDRSATILRFLRLSADSQRFFAQPPAAVMKDTSWG